MITPSLEHWHNQRVKYSIDGKLYFFGKVLINKIEDKQVESLSIEEIERIALYVIKDPCHALTIWNQLIEEQPWTLKDCFGLEDIIINKKKES